MGALLNYVAAVFAGALAGFINTLAGCGSAITLPALLLLGLDSTEANATNRVGVLLASLVGASTFRQGGVLDSRGIKWLIAPTLAGALVGTGLAMRLGKREMDIVIAAVLVFMLALILIQPKRWLRDEGEARTDHRGLLTALIFFGIGAYGGFIQAGVGVLLLAALVLRAHYTLVRANAIKVILVFALTLVALGLFAWQGLVHWRIGLLMATGQCTGAWLAARFASRHPQANVWIRRLLIVIIVVALARMGYAWAMRPATAGPPV